MDKRHTIWYILAGLSLIIILVVAIILNNNSPTSNTSYVTNSLDIDNGDLKINWERYSNFDIELEDTLTIAKSGTYHLTGSIEDGSIIVNVVNGKVKLILDNVEIKNSNGPAINCLAADDLVIELVGENTLEDGSKYDAKLDEDISGAIYSKGDLTFQGDGKLNIIANFQDGIVSKDDLKFNSGTYNITAVDDGIRGKDSVYIVDGDFSINTKADAIKSTNQTTSSKGFVIIEKGTFNILAGDDGIHAETKLLIYDGNITINKSYEGLESPNILINNGIISITSNDDGINAGSSDTTNNNTRQGAFDVDTNCVITINDGDIYVNAAGDGIDSNGYINFNGGKVVVDGPTNNGNGAIDAGANATINGGTVIAVGASGMAESLNQKSTVYNASIYFEETLKAGTKITIKDSNGETIIKHTSAKTFSHMTAGAEEFKQGETYTIYIDSEKYQSFTISDIVTIVGDSRGSYQMDPGPNDSNTNQPPTMPINNNQKPTPNQSVK